MRTGPVTMEPTTRNDTQTPACRRKVPCAKHCRWRWPAVSCAAAARSRRAQLALCRRHALDRTGKQSWHAAAEPYTPHGNGLDETSTAAMEAVLRHRKPEKISPPEAPCVGRLGAYALRPLHRCYHRFLHSERTLTVAERAAEWMDTP